ncbi:unnamed protein product [Symbiodinium sp. CCMP2592]|nr:unnamed protein product [Symbiodinium sp. CCMP2592]
MKTEMVSIAPDRRTRTVEVGSFAASSLLRSSSVVEPLEGSTGAWQSSIDAVKSLRCSNLKLDIVSGNAMLVTASTAQRWGWIQALSMLAEMAFCSLALSEVSCRVAVAGCAAQSWTGALALLFGSPAEPANAWMPVELNSCAIACERMQHPLPMQPLLHLTEKQGASVLHSTRIREVCRSC